MGGWDRLLSVPLPEASDLRPEASGVATDGGIDTEDSAAPTRSPSVAATSRARKGLVEPTFRLANLRAKIQVIRQVWGQAWLVVGSHRGEARCAVTPR